MSETLVASAEPIWPNCPGCQNGHCKCEGQCCSDAAQTANISGDCSDEVSEMCKPCQKCAPQKPTWPQCPGCQNGHCKCEGQCCSAAAQTANINGDCSDEVSEMCKPCQQCAPQKPTWPLCHGCQNGHCKCEGQCCSAAAQTTNIHGECADEVSEMCKPCQQCAPQTALDGISAVRLQDQQGVENNSGLFLVACGASCMSAVVLVGLISWRRRTSSEDYQAMSENLIQVS